MGFYLKPASATLCSPCLNLPLLDMRTCPFAVRFLQHCPGSHPHFVSVTSHCTEGGLGGGGGLERKRSEKWVRLGGGGGEMGGGEKEKWVRWGGGGGGREVRSEWDGKEKWVRWGGGGRGGGGGEREVSEMGGGGGEVSEMGGGGREVRSEWDGRGGEREVSEMGVGGGREVGGRDKGSNWRRWWGDGDRRWVGGRWGGGKGRENVFVCVWEKEQY